MTFTFKTDQGTKTIDAATAHEAVNVYDPNVATVAQLRAHAASSGGALVMTNETGHELIRVEKAT
jgi:hypothetical protein